MALLEYKAYRICDDNPVAKAKFEECAKYHINNMDVRNSLYAEGLDDGQFRRLGNILNQCMSRRSCVDFRSGKGRENQISEPINRNGG